MSVIEENISSRFLKDFEIIPSTISISRGYPYDYKSIMHYSSFAFTKNGKPTIKVMWLKNFFFCTIISIINYDKETVK